MHNNIVINSFDHQSSHAIKKNTSYLILNNVPICRKMTHIGKKL